MSEFSVNLPPRLPTANAAANVLTAVVPDPPRHLTQLDNGTILKGIVQGRDNEGLLVVATDKGTLKLSTAANLAPGSQVLLEVRATGDRLQVLVLSVEAGASGATSGQGTARGGATTSSTAGASGQPAPTRPATPAPIPVAVVGSVLVGTIVQASPDTLTQLFRALLPSPVLPAATVQPPASGQAQPNQVGTPPSQTEPAATPPAPVGQAAILPKALGTTLQTEIQAQIETLFLNAAPNAPPSASGSGQGGQLPQNLAASLKLLAALPTGSEVKLRLIAIAPGPGQPVILPAAGAGTPHVMAGRIVGYTATGHAVLNSPLGAIVLQGSLAVPVGTELSFAIEPALPVPAGAATITAPALPQLLLSMSRGWPSLMEAIALMRQGSPSASLGADPTAVALAHLPQPGPKLAAGLLAAIQALRSGNIEALLGGLAAQRSGSAERDEVVRKLRQEFGQISSFAQDKAGTEWRCCFIPLLDDGTVRQINLFYRRDRGKDRKGEDAEKSGTRFIVEVDMSKMGPFQFDGLVREKRFDLMVRSHVALTPKMREDIGSLFQQALVIGDYTGNLVFQKVKDFPVSPLEEVKKSATLVSA